MAGVKSVLMLFLIWINQIQVLAAVGSDPEALDNSTLVTVITSANATRTEDIVKLKHLVLLPLSRPTNDEGKIVQKWERGLEMFPGSQIAADTINRDPHLLNGYELELVNANVDSQCLSLHEYPVGEALFPFANGTLDNDIVGMLGLFCDRLLRILSPLAGRSHFGLFQLSGTISTDVRGQRQRYTHLNFIVPSEAAYYETLFILMRKLDRKRVLIIDNDIFKKSSVRNSTLLRQNLSISYLEFSSDVSTMPKEIRMSEKTVVFVSATLKQTADLMCAVYDDGLVWPQYMWIIQHYNLKDILSYQTGSCSKENLNHSLFLKFQNKQADTLKKLVTRSTYETYIQQYMKILNESSDVLNYNEYANVMHDSVWAFVLALNRSLDRILQFNMTIIDFVNKTVMALTPP